MFSSMLQDRFGRSIDYVRLSVTDRCDLRCSYCMPKGFRGFEEPKDWLTFDEIERLLGIFVRLGTRRVRLTGGEPLLRRNLPELAGRLSAAARPAGPVAVDQRHPAGPPCGGAARGGGEPASTSASIRSTAPAWRPSPAATACSRYSTA